MTFIFFRCLVKKNNSIFRHNRLGFKFVPIFLLAIFLPCIVEAGSLGTIKESPEQESRFDLIGNVFDYKVCNLAIGSAPGRLVLAENEQVKKSRTEINGGLNKFLSSHQGDSLVMVSLGQEHSDEKRADGSGNNSPEAGNVRGISRDSICTTHKNSSFWLGPIGLPLQFLLGCFSGLFVAIRWGFPLVERFLDFLHNLLLIS